jgi:hypothetical protein
MSQVLESFRRQMAAMAFQILTAYHFTDSMKEKTRLLVGAVRTKDKGNLTVEAPSSQRDHLPKAEQTALGPKLRA